MSQTIFVGQRWQRKNEPLMIEVTKIELDGKFGEPDIHVVFPNQFGHVRSAIVQRSFLEKNYDLK